MSNEETCVLKAQLDQERDEEKKKSIRNRIAEGHLPLVVRIAKKYGKYGVPVEDLIGAGNLGLCEAIEKFDPTKGWFSDYASLLTEECVRKIKESAINKIREIIGSERFHEMFPSAISVKEVQQAASRLTPKQKIVMYLKYGFDRRQNPSDQEIGTVLGKGRPAISRDLKRARDAMDKGVMVNGRLPRSIEKEELYKHVADYLYPQVQMMIEKVRGHSAGQERPIGDLFGNASAEEKQQWGAVYRCLWATLD
jgi:RNA polymerase sigma factor (sigma-70 family)